MKDEEHGQYSLIKHLFNKYISSRVLSDLAPNISGAITNDRHYAIYKAIEVELTLIHAGWNQKNIPLRRKFAREQIEEIIRELKSGMLRPIIPANT